VKSNGDPTEVVYAPKHVLYEPDEVEILRAIRNPVMIQQFWVELAGDDADEPDADAAAAEASSDVSEASMPREKSINIAGFLSFRVVKIFCKKTFPSLLASETASSRALMATVGDEDVNDDIQLTQLSKKHFKEFMMNAFYYSRVLSGIPPGDDTDYYLTTNQFQQLTVDIRANMPEGDHVEVFEQLSAPKTGALVDTNEAGEVIVEVDLVVRWFQTLSEDQSLRDAIPNISSIGFTEAEQELLTICENPSQLLLLWRKIDTNHNGKVSFMELKGYIHSQHKHLDHKAALMKAYMASCQAGKDGDDGAIDKPEFPLLLANCIHYHKLYRCFMDLNTSYGQESDKGPYLATKAIDKGIDFNEFFQGLSKLGMHLDADEAHFVFDRINGGGGDKITFSEFCDWYTKYAEEDELVTKCTEKFKMAKEASYTKAKKAASMKLALKPPE